MSEDATPVAHVTESRLVTLGLAVALAAMSGLVAADGTVPSWEESIFHAVNDLPDWLRPVMWVAQLAGLLLVPAVVAVVALVMRRYRLAIGLAVLIPLKLVVEKQVVKQLVERERPGTSICELDATCGNFRDVPLEGLSFVSGHAIIAWAVATLLWPYLPRTGRWVVVAIATANAIARVYLGAHNPLDVVGGAAIGVALGVAITMAVGTPRRTPAVAAGSPS